jgi:hypothetical protein
LGLRCCLSLRFYFVCWPHWAFSFCYLLFCVASQRSRLPALGVLGFSLRERYLCLRTGKALGYSGISPLSWAWGWWFLDHLVLLNSVLFSSSGQLGYIIPRILFTTLKPQLQNQPHLTCQFVLGKIHCRDLCWVVEGTLSSNRRAYIDHIRSFSLDS